jgi:LysR family transcriptional regulator, hydrogen peroxide-inducible genes activator
MTLQELRYLVAVADKGHFVRAAEACHVGQPTLSTQLKKLEDYLGVTLFERNKHHLLPTPVGELIIVQARIVLGVLEGIRELARQGQEVVSGALRIGVIPTLGPYLIPHLLPFIHETFPKLRLFLREDLTSNLLERLRAGKLDAVLLALPIHDDGVEVMELFSEPFQVALPAGHRLTAKRQLEERDLVDECVLLLEEGHCLREQALAISGHTDTEQRDELQATSLETLRQMVAAGVGCTLLPALAALPGIGSVHNGLVQMRPFAQPRPSRTIGIVWRHRYPREDVIKQLAKLILTNLPRGVIAKTPLAEQCSLRETDESNVV